MARSKYNAVRTTVDGITFASKAEARRYSELKLLEKAGEITHLELQPKYEIRLNGKKICNYIADFRYINRNQVHDRSGAQGCTVTEDVKGMKTPIYKLKKKLVEAMYPGVMIIEIK